MISLSDALFLNQILTELHKNDLGEICKKLVIDLYGVKYTILRINKVEHFQYDVKDNRPSLFVTVIEICLYKKSGVICGEYSLPLSESKSDDVSRAIKSAYAAWRKTLEMGA